MAVAAAIAATKTGDSMELMAEGFGNGTLTPLPGLTKDDTAERSSLQQVINMPVRSIASLEVMA